MNNDISKRILAAVLGLAGLAGTAFATTWYVNDADTTLDVYCTAAGNDANDGKSPATPKLSIAAVGTSTNFMPGDVLYIDTGTYNLGKNSSVFACTGTADARIAVKGSPNGTIITSSADPILQIQATYTDFSDLTLKGYAFYNGLTLAAGTSYCHFNRFFLYCTTARGIRLGNPCVSNRFSHGVVANYRDIGVLLPSGARGTQFHSMTIVGGNTGFDGASSTLNRIENTIVRVGGTVFSSVPAYPVSNNLFQGQSLVPGCRTMAEAQRMYPEVFANDQGGTAQFVNEAKLDFHLTSPHGHWVEERNESGYLTGGMWVTNSTIAMSPGIDFGYDNEYASWTNEPAPNGGRVNVGAYGGTAEASKGHPDGVKWLYASSFNDGGNLVGSGVFEWRAGGFADGDKVKLQYSHDGTKWSNIVSSVKANAERYAWTNVPAGAEGAWTKWRMVAADSSTGATNGAVFGLRKNGETKFTYYVNDASRTGDLWCTAAGSDANAGADAAHPKATLKSVLDTYQLLPGDVVKVDTGVYEDTDGTDVWTTTLSALDAGSTNGYVTIQGSTNGTVFAGTSKSRDVMEVSGSYYDVRDIEVTGGRYGISVSGANNRFKRVAATNNTQGIRVNAAGNALERVTAWKNTQYGVYVQGGAGNTLDHSVVWENGTAALWGASNTLTVANSVLGGSSGTVLGGSGIPSGDWNVAKAPKMSGSRADLSSLLAVALVGTWGHTVVRDPGFKDAEKGDFHLVSGSPAIDAGNPSADVGAEPSPNGGRVNIGLYGGTAEAAKSGTGAWVQLLSFVDGGTLDTSVTNVIRWNAGNLPAGATLTLWIKRSASSAWETLATGLDAAIGEYEYWKAVEENQSARGAYLKLSLDSDPKVASETETSMTYKDGAFPYYVNDSSTEGDVYCSAPGIAGGEGAGLSPDAPMLSLEALISEYAPFSAGDVIYVDTGTYATNRTAWVINDNMAGTVAKPIRIIGSTNAAAGGSVIGNRGSRQPIGMNIGAGAQYVEISGLTFTNVNGNAVTVSNAPNITLDRVQVRGATGAGISVLGRAENVTVKHSAAAGCGTGLALGECTDAMVEQCVFVNNTVGVSAAANSGATMENSALSASVDGAVLYQVAPGTFTADYNGLHAGGNARVSTNRADNVCAWQKASGLDAHSVPGEPLFADAGAFDYHLMTKRTLGRWMDDGHRTTDEESSPLLAAGKPEADGTRQNIGMHGGTAKASLAPAGEWLRAVSFNDAGGVGAETVPLRWVASEAMSNRMVKVEVSVDGGKTWKSVKTKVAASAGEVEWSVGSTADTPAGLWRVTSEADAGVTDTCDAFFAVRKAPLKIYVAPGTVNTNEAAYVTGVGAADHWQATKAAPIDSLATVLAEFDLEGGDTVYMERGTYAMNLGMKMGLKQSGTATNAVRIVGVTNRPFDGATVALANRGYGSVLLDLQRASNVRFEALTFSNAWTGVQAGNSSGIEFDKVRLTHMATNAVNAQSGADLVFSHGVVDDSVYGGVCANTGAVVRVTQSYLAASSQLPFVMRGGRAYVTNSVMAASGMGKAVYSLQSGAGGVTADYNDIRAENGANVASGGGREANRFLNEWQGTSGNDMHSVGYEPLMKDEGAFDYHLLSKAGYYDAVQGKFVKTNQTSRLIDLGAPGAEWSAEPKPNGSRANIGVYGGTAEASKSAATNFIAPLTMSDGGTIRGEVDLYWTYSANYKGNERVNVLLSVDGGHTWTNIQTNVYLNAGTVKWNSTNAISTGQGMWKVELATNKTVYGQTETLFAIKNDPLVYYVNDTNTTGDVYCTAKGSATGSGTEPGDPVDSLSRLLGKYKLEAGDKVYVDTGTYAETGGVVFSASFGVATNWLTIQGSTNRAGGGTVITNSSATPVIDLQGMGSVDLRDLTLQGGSHGVLLSGATSNRFWRVASVGARVNGFDIAQNSGGNMFDECAAVGFASTGLVLRTATGKTDFTGTNEWNGGLFITKGMNTNGTPLATGTVVHATSGRLTVQNSAFVLNGSLDTALLGTASSLVTDHNDYWLAQEGALLAKWNVSPVPTYGVRQQAVDTLSAWRVLSGLDGESFSADPLWANADNLDFHPKSEGRRYDQTKSTWTNDPFETSPLIGTGAMADGVRRGVGWYGATGDAEASQAPGKTTVVPLDFADGGVANGKVALRWIARGSNLSEKVSVLYVASDGTPGNVGTVAASAGRIEWDTAARGSDAAMRWGFGKGTDFSEVEAARPFTLHNGPITYYLNDASTDGDVYCTTNGALGNTGLSADSPLDSLPALLKRYDLEPGDIVRWDAGDYSMGVATVDFRDSGTAENPVIIQGAPHGKTMVHGALQVANARGVSLRDLSFDSTGVPVNTLVVQYAEDIGFNGVDARGSDWSAMSVSCSSNVLGQHMILANAKTNGLACEASYRAEFGFMSIVSNTAAAVVTRRQTATGGSDTNRHNAFMSLSNSIVASRGDRVPIYDVYGMVYADHNDLHATGGALIAMTHAGQVAKELRTVNAWYNEQGQDASSLSHDPLFVEGRSGDFHLKSSAGHYESATGKWVSDTATSPALDAGDPSLDPSLPELMEPTPNGGRVNLGRYGGTDEASKTPADSGLTLIALNDGGRASGTEFPITWIARGNTTNATLTIRYIDGNATNVLATGVKASEGVWKWDTTTVKPSVQGRLELVPSDGTPSVKNTEYFSVRNPGNRFDFYVNDTYNPELDVYCTATGDNNADGLTPATPMADLNRLLEKYKLESGDTVWVDTGRYTSGISPWRITQDDSAEALGSAPVTIQGSTNSLYNGTVLERQGNPVGIQVDYAIGLAIRNITVSNTSDVAIVLNSSYETSLEWMTVGNAATGIQVNGGSAASISHCVLHGVEGTGVSVGGTVATNTIFPTLEHSVVWKPLGVAVAVNGNYKLSAKHNVFAPVADQYVYSVGQRSTLVADYNAFVMATDSRVFKRQREGGGKPVVYETVGAWVTASGQDAHSYDGEPDFADAVKLDFHLKSRAGRWNPSTKKFVNDKTTSPLVDAGNPDAEVEKEPSPNGARVNIGLYGGTLQASKSDAAGRYNLLTYNNGGVAAGRVALNWNALGTATGTTVRIEVSLDNGKTWPITVGEGIEATVGGVLWNSAERGSCAQAKWRLVDETGIIKQPVESVMPFVLHNSGIAYYVNDDTVESGDYCTAGGYSGNDGLTPATPKRWLSEILETYNLEPGDVVYIDSGVYQPSGTEIVGDLDAGEYGGATDTRVTIQGQTNLNAEATLYVTPDPEMDFVKLDGTCGIKLSHLQFIGASNAVVVSQSEDIDAEWLRAKDGWRGISMGNSSSNVWIRHSVFQGNADAGVYFNGAQTRKASVEHSVLWSNRYGVYVQQGTVTVSNSVVGVSDDDAFAYYARKEQSPHDICGDYNDLYLERGNMAGLQSGSGTAARTSLYSRVSAWTSAMKQEGHSLVQNPLFVDVQKGDFHLKSAGGHWDAQAGWVMTDGVSSPLIDSGAPSSKEWVNEPSPNGRRVNIGLYGGTSEASRTPEEGWITALTLVDGGSASGEIELRWQVGGGATNDTVTIEFSHDGGTTWKTIEPDWPAALGAYTWNSKEWGATAQGMWRIMSKQDGSIGDGSMVPFVLRNGGSIAYYVNDIYERGDVYCTTDGNDLNDGLTPETPKATLQAILDSYELAPEDIVYVDAGTYTVGSPAVTIDGRDSGWTNENLFVTIQGSTNPPARTVFRAPSASASVFDLNYAENVKVRDLTIQNAQIGMRMDHTVGCELENVRFERNKQAGLSLDYAEGTKMAHTVFWDNQTTTSGVAVAIGRGDLAMNHCVLWGSRTAVSLGQASGLSVSNSVLDAREANGRIYSAPQTVNVTNMVSADYNAYSCRDGALIAEQQHQVGGSDYYGDLQKWYAASGQDGHSTRNDPAFVDPNNGDFHLQSAGGYFTTNNWWETSTNWAFSFGTSTLLAAGDPAEDASAETSPNGGVVNIGAYGGTSEASICATNPPWVRAMALNESCVVSAPVMLHWTYGGVPDDATVRLEYTTSHWTTSKPIAEGIPIKAREYWWDITKDVSLALELQWRVVVEGSSAADPDASDVYVSVKTDTYTYYINDDETTGDVYCKAVGSPWTGEENQGRTNSMPLDSLKSLLAAYPVGAGDVIFIDTGHYDLENDGAVFGGNQSGLDGMPLVIAGSTNGSVFTSATNGFVFQNMRQVVVSNVTVQNAKNGFLLQNVSDVELAGVQSTGNSENGISIANGANVEIHHAVLAANKGYGVYANGNSSGSRNLENATIANNDKGGVYTDRGMGIRNSIVAGTNSAPLLTIPSQNASFNGDYNLYWTTAANGVFATNAYKKTGYASVKQWQTEEGLDVHSFRADPLFVDPANGNYRLQSRQGVWNGTGWMSCGETSWAIDMADPSAAYASESSPNGARRNLGAYGNTGTASKTDDSKKELMVLSLRDGGVATIDQLLLWTGRGFANPNPTNAVRLEYSPDDGKTWKLIATSTVGAGAVGYVWEDKYWEPSPLAQWRVVLVDDPTVVGQTPTSFTYRPTPLVYYVNDLSRVGDVYTTAIGDPGNNGYEKDSPLDSVEAVLARYQLTPGDQLWIDAGEYELERSIEWTSLNAGMATNPVIIRGSTNPVVPSVIVASKDMQEPAFSFIPTHDVVLSHVRLLGFTNGVSIIKDNRGITLEHLDIQKSVGAAVSVNQAQDTVLRHVLMRDGDGVGLSASQCRISLDSCVVWSNQSHAISMGQGTTLLMTNSILGATGFGQYCYYSFTNVAVKADYNDLFLADSAQIASINGVQYERLPQWMTAYSTDIHSLSTDPLFHDPANGDFHPRSVAGRFNPATETWVKDQPVAGMADFSPLIDMGHTNMAWEAEGMPNGGRRNIGLYGGTAEASKSNTNAWLMAVTAMSGGLLNGTFYLSWGHGGDLDTNSTVRLEYSPYNGEGEWTFIAAAKLTSGAYYWKSDALNGTGGEKWMTSPEARWRVGVQLSETNWLWDATELPFGLRNNPFKYYLNDFNRAGDLWCTTIGSDDNSGFWTNAPKATLQSLLENIDVEPTDEIYMDTGIYEMTDTNRPVQWLASDSGAPGQPVKWIGSTNGTVLLVRNNFAGGSIFDSAADYVTASNIGFQVGARNTQGVTFQGTGLQLSAMSFSNAAVGLNSTASSYNNMTVRGGSVSLSGLSNRVSRLDSRLAPLTLVGTNAMLQNSVIYSTNAARTAVVVRAASASLTNCTVVAPRGTAIAKSGAGTLYLDGNILVAGGGRNNAVLDWQSGGLVSDWNDFFTLDPLTWVGINGDSKWEKLAYWQQSSGKDAHSVAFDPAFADMARGDFHLFSTEGRWDATSNRWLPGDNVHSPLIDMANPELGTGDEVMPNGYRRNMGAYGGTEEASKSGTNFWVRALTQNDGGVLSGDKVTLRWAANQMPYWGDKRVNLLYSPDGGATWTNIASGVSAQSGSYTWDTTQANFPDSFNALWKVEDAADASVSDATDTSFALRNHEADFYLSPSGDDGNDGLSTNTPMRTLQALLDTYDLEGGDTVHAASGDYVSGTNVLVIWSRSGEAGNPVKFEGALKSDGTAGVQLGTGHPCLEIKASHMDWNGLSVGGAGSDRGVGVVLTNTTGITFRNLDVYNMATGIEAVNAFDTSVLNSSFRATDAGVSLFNSRSNILRNLTFAKIPADGAGIKLRQSDGNTLENNIFVPDYAAYAYDIGSGTSMLTEGAMDYNLYDFEAPGSGFFAGSETDLRKWQLGMDRDYRSALTNALLCNIDRGDLHPQSEYGRKVGSKWTNDPPGTNSFAVDHGNPALSVGAEPKNNGGRINIGRFGGTKFASKGSTNVEFGVRTLDNRESVASDDATWPLVWDAHLVPSNTTVYVQCTASSWSNNVYTLSTNMAYDEYFVWTITDKYQGQTWLWRVISADGTLLAATTKPFSYILSKFGFRRPPYMEHGLMRFTWTGALAGKRYVIKYSDDFGKTWQLWPRAYNGPEKIHRSNFVMQPGETAEYYIFEDLTSFGKTQRWYRLFQLDEN